jgi:hypothetical protein
MENKLQKLDMITTIFHDTIQQSFSTEQIKNINMSQIKPVIEELIINNLKYYLEATNMYVSNIQKKIETYIMDFLNNEDTQYYYIKKIKLFVKYDNDNYDIIDEDVIWIHIINSINDNSDLIKYKHNIKDSIILQIKGRGIDKSIPDTTTIQNVLTNLFNIICLNKDESKYFLTIIGDFIFKKNRDLNYFVNAGAKEFIGVIGDICHYYFNTTKLSNQIKCKYYHHDYNTTRLIRFTEHIANKTLWYGYVKKNILNIMAVACHYSSRYKSAEHFLTECENDSLVKYSLYLKNTSETDVVTDFLNEYTHKDAKLSIKNNDMSYLWKLYIKNKKIPNVLFAHQLKILLGNVLVTNDNKTEFLHITSHQLIYVKNFNEFWSTMVEETNNDEVEMDELHNMYNIWLKDNSIKENTNTEKKLRHLIGHFFPHIEIDDKKYIMNITVKMWDKKESIIHVLNNIDKNYFAANDNITLFQLYKLYIQYNGNKHNYVVSRKYFNQFIQDYIPDEHFDGSTISTLHWKDGTV